MKDEHVNESILSEEILEDQKKNRIDHMTYLPDMEVLESDVMDRVISEMNQYDYDQYTEANVRRALARDNRTPEDFKALLSPAALPLLEEIAQARQALDDAYQHFQNASDPDLIDCYIYEGNAAWKRYRFLLKQARML